MYHNDVPRDHLNRASGKVIPWESRPTREIGKSGRRAKGGRRNTSELPGLQGRTMRKSLLIPNAMMCPPLESCVLGNEPAQFGKGRMKKGQQWDLVSRLLHSEGAWRQ